MSLAETSSRPRKAAKPAKARKTKTGTSLIIVPNKNEVAALAPASVPSRMKLNVVELSERPWNVSFKDAATKSLGNLDGYTVLGSDVLVATYIQSRTTPGGIITTDKSVDENRYQGKIGLVLKLGESAFKYSGAYAYEGTVPKVGDYVAFHTSDTREIGIKGVSCRTVDSQLIRMVVPDPDAVY